MIRMVPNAHGPTEPIVCCDTCGEPITGSGIVAWSQNDPWPAFYHKTYQNPGCDPDNFDFWIELCWFLTYLERNTLVRAS